MAELFQKDDRVRYKCIKGVLVVIGTRKSDGYVACWDGEDAGTITFCWSEKLEHAEDEQ